MHEITEQQRQEKLQLFRNWIAYNKARDEFFRILEKDGWTLDKQTRTNQAGTFATLWKECGGAGEIIRN